MKDSISIFVPTLAAGGAEKQAAILAKLLSEFYIVHLVVLYGEKEASESILGILKGDSVQILKLRGSLLCRTKSYLKFLKSHKIVMSFNYLTMCDFLGAFVEKISGVKFVYNGIRNTKLETHKLVLEWISHNFIATGTILNCYSGVESFKKKAFFPHKLFVIPNCFLNIKEPAHRLDKEVKTVITVGRFHPQKDYRTAIETVSLLKKNRCDFRFIIVGYGVLEGQIRTWVKEFGIEEVVDIYINPSYIPMLLEKSDIYLSTSLYEGTSNSIMEAMNYSLPIVATDVGDNCYLVKNGRNGFLHSVGDAEGIAGSLSKLLSDLQLRNSMGISANQILKHSYSEKVFIERYLKLAKYNL